MSYGMVGIDQISLQFSDQIWMALRKQAQGAYQLRRAPLKKKLTLVKAIILA